MSPTVLTSRMAGDLVAEMTAMLPSNRSESEMTAELWVTKLRGLQTSAARHATDAVLAELKFFPAWSEFRMAYDAAIAADFSNRPEPSIGQVCGVCGKRRDHTRWCDGITEVRTAGGRFEKLIATVYPKDGPRADDMLSHGRDGHGPFVTLDDDRRIQLQTRVETARERATARWGLAPSGFDSGDAA